MVDTKSFAAFGLTIYKRTLRGEDGDRVLLLHARKALFLIPVDRVAPIHSNSEEPEAPGHYDAADLMSKVKHLSHSL